MPAPIVFFDIAGPDLASQSNFYSKVFGRDVGAAGQLSAPSLASLPGLLRVDPPGAMLYMGVSDVTATLALVTANGGNVKAPRFEVPGVVVLGLFADPAGNQMGVVEMDGDRAKIP